MFSVLLVRTRKESECSACLRLASSVFFLHDFIDISHHRVIVGRNAVSCLTVAL